MILQAKEPVKLRYKKLKNGNTSLYLDGLSYAFISYLFGRSSISGFRL